MVSILNNLDSVFSGSIRYYPELSTKVEYGYEHFPRNARYQAYWPNNFQIIQIEIQQLIPRIQWLTSLTFDLLTDLKYAVH